MMLAAAAAAGAPPDGPKTFLGLFLSSIIHGESRLLLYSANPSAECCFIPQYMYLICVVFTYKKKEGSNTAIWVLIYYLIDVYAATQVKKMINPFEKYICHIDIFG